MKKPILPSRSLLFQCLIYSAFICFVAMPQSTFAHGEKSSAAMAQAANDLVATFNAEQKEKVVFKFEDRNRVSWHFFPNRSNRAGLPMNALNKKQRKGVNELLNVLLTVEAFQDQENLRLIHGLKKDLEAPDNPRHLYFIAVFGQPSTKSTWGWRYEGHHLSLNCTLVDGQHFAVTPSFWGVAPVTVQKGPYKGLEAFKKERKLALGLVNSFTDKQKSLAASDKKKSPGTATKLNRKGYQPPVGIRFGDLDKSQQSKLLELVRAYAGKFRPDILKQIDGRKKIEDTSTMTFAYSPKSKKNVHDYSIQTKDYLIEFSNPGDNHVHSAWRDFDGDFGRDLIAEHLKVAHGKDEPNKPVASKPAPPKKPVAAKKPVPPGKPVKAKKPTEHKEIPKLDLSGFTARQQASILKRANNEMCDCGCSMTVAGCRHDDPTCKTSIGLVKAIVKAVTGVQLQD